MNTAGERFDPIEASEKLKAGFIDYITTTFHIADPVYKAALGRELKKEGFLTKGPYLDINGSYRTGRALRVLMDQGLASRGFETLEPVAEKDRELKLERPLYLHQEEALLKADAGNNLIVTTGTGSGKTECFLLPILQALLEEERTGTLDNGVRAILIYPMNALANDQMKRMRVILKGHPKIKFGIYTGNTEQSRKKAEDTYYKSFGRDAALLQNELLSRDEMRQTPPHILITNYSMLEYMMLRPKDDKVFSGAKLRYIVLDEAHIYKGTTGMETAMLMRRLRARISTRDTVQYILTSATLGDKDANREITQFGRQLCGVDFHECNIIRSQDATPEMKAMNDYPLELFHRLANPANNVSTALEQFRIPDPAPDAPDGEKLYELMLTSRLFALLRGESAKTMEIGALSRAMGISRQALLDLVAVCSRAEKQKTALLKARIHYFVRALEGAYVTLGGDPRLMLTRQEYTADDKKVFEVAICKDCGRLALVGKIEDDCLRQVARKTDHAPDECDYFLLWEDEDERIVFGDEDPDEDEEQIEATDEADYAVCPHCGAIDGWSNQSSGSICDCAEKPVHIRQVNRTRKNKEAKCPACGRGSFRAFYLGNEAATSVLGTELFEQLPTRVVTAKPTQQQRQNRFSSRKARPMVDVKEMSPQFLCFSDSRSEAAHFPVSMEREYQRFLRNRGIWRVAKELMEEGTYDISVPAFVNRLIRVFDAEGSFDQWEPKHDKSDRDTLHERSKENAWMAVVSELFNSRHALSLSSVGLLHFEYDSELYNECREAIISELQESGLTETDAAALMQQIFLDGVYTGALNAGKSYNFSAEAHEAIFYSPSERHLVRCKGPDAPKDSSGWSARKRENGNYYPSTRLHRLMNATGWEADYANKFLQDLWDSVLSDTENQFAFDICDFRIHLNEKPGAKTWRCRKCGSVTVRNVKGRCGVLQCGGALEAVEPAALQEGNHYVNRYRGERMKPLQMREHTAQLSRNGQTQYQQAFVDGKLNALSCSTTFEMGVDVGGLETVFMRDIPPGPANYVQRAGRAGRAAHTAAYVLTYAKLSSHDFTFYNNPETVISGKIKAPVFTLENEKVLYRHIFAVALAEFLASHSNEDVDVYDGDNRNRLVNGDGYDRLKAFLAQPTQRLQMLLRRSVPSGMHARLGITDGSWREQLIGETGVLETAITNYKTELALLEKELNKARKEKNDTEVSKISWELRRFRAAPEDNCGKRSLIEFLTRNNVLPKYGFPVDTVELQVGARQTDATEGLQLSRDLQMAIAEYAPGAQIIADMKMYTSRYIRKMDIRSRGSKMAGWDTGYYATCPGCSEMNYTENATARTAGHKCISCEQKIPRHNWHETISPRRGFITENADGQTVPLRRPERDYKTEDYYVGDGRGTVLLTQEFQVGSETVRLQASKNDSLAVVGLGDHVVCPLCGYATNDGKTALPEKHKNARGYECDYKSTGKPSKAVRLSHKFKTDVASIAFQTPEATDRQTMVSVMYAVLEGLSRELDIERTDIKGCLHQIKWEGSGRPIYTLILYDAVAGGAGHVRRIVTKDGAVFEKVLQRAYQVVSNCKCEPSCYACIRNYYNQKIHDQLDRRKAAAFLRPRLGPFQPVLQEETAADEQIEISVSGGDPTENRTWKDLYERFYFDGDGAEWDRQGVAAECCLIMPEVTLAGEVLCPYLVWADRHVMLFDEIDAGQKETLTQLGWHVDTMDIPAEKLARILRGEN